MHRIKNNFYTLYKLGLRNVANVLIYRMKVRFGWYRSLQPIAEIEYQHDACLIPSTQQHTTALDRVSIAYFNSTVFRVSSPPNWISNPYTNSSVKNDVRHWSEISDFNPLVGDIKVVWELSRFDWLIKVSWQEVFENSNPDFSANQWLLNWCRANPVNQGYNWKCAQEVSIRSLNFILAWLIHGRVPNDPAVTDFLISHANRIRPTIAYARAQNNNHGTTEAAALYVIGTILADSEKLDSRTISSKLLADGRNLLEDRVAHLIAPDGTFSQYSINYHRMMLDTLSFTECIRRRFSGQEFSTQFYEKSAQAAWWLHRLVDPISGDAPNIGANDGSQLFNCDSKSYRDFRPSCNLAMKLFCARNVYPEQPHSLSFVFTRFMEQLKPVIKSDADAKKELGIVFKRVGTSTTFAVLKCPEDNFRPSQSDALHLDVWHKGINVVRDAGTYSYNPPDEHNVDLGETAFHSTIELDNRSQMPKLSRFLYGRWLKSAEIESEKRQETNTIIASYIDWKGGLHCRLVTKTKAGFHVEDSVGGTVEQFTLRWRLPNCDWSLNNNRLQSDIARIVSTATNPISVKVVKSIESREYLELDTVTVLEVSGPVNTIVRTHIELI